MASPENFNWAFDLPLIDNGSVSSSDFGVAGSAFFWTSQGITPAPDACEENSGSLAVSAGQKETGSKKRGRSESSGPPSTKACREKMRRDRLNDRFMELSSILEPENPKTDKAAILSDAVRMVNLLRTEAQNLKGSNENLQEKINDLKTEKVELRNEKQRLKQEKENLEHQIKLLNTPQTTFVPPPIMPGTFAVPQGQGGPPKMMMPVVGFPGYPMWTFMPPAINDTSQDVESFPPVA